MSPIAALSRGEYVHSLELALIRHELSQPLTYLMTSMSLLRLRLERDLKSCEGAASFVAALAAAHESVGHLGEMVRCIGVDGAEDIGPVNVADVVERTLLMAEDGIARHAELVRDIDCRPVVSANATRLRQVLLNLLTNSVFAILDRSEGRGTIVVRLAPDGSDRVALEVLDDGIGIREGERSMVGELHYTCRPERGRGFGLALSRSIVESYGGTFRISARSTRGTKVRVVLPLLGSDAIAEAG